MRIVTYKIGRAIGPSDAFVPWIGGRLVWELVPGSYDSDAVYPNIQKASSTDENGEGEVGLWTNAEGAEASVIRVTLPSQEIKTFTLEAGDDPIDLTTLLALGAIDTDWDAALLSKVISDNPDLKGEDGEGFNPLSTWDADTAYARLDVVSHDGAGWYANEDTAAGEEPGVNGKWSQLIGNVVQIPEGAESLQILGANEEGVIDWYDPEELALMRAEDGEQLWAAIDEITDVPTPVGETNGRMLAVLEDELVYVDAPSGGGGGGGGSVDSVNGQTGVVVLDAGDVGADPSGTAAAAVAGEASTRAADDSALDTRVDALELGLADETTTREDADDILAAAISGEASDRAAADSAHVAAGDPHPQYVLESREGQASGIATLDSGGKIPSAQLPAIAVGETFSVASQAAMLALTAQIGDVAIRTDQSNSRYLLTGTASTLADWKILEHPADAVSSVFGRVGAVTAAPGDYSKSDVGLGNVDNTSDANKPVSTAQAAADAAVQAAAIQRSNHTGSQTASTISDFAATVRSTVLTGLSLASAAAITATSTALEAFGQLQKQITDNLAALAATVRSTVLTGLSLSASTTVAATHTVLEAIGFLQAQIQEFLLNVISPTQLAANTDDWSPTGLSTTAAIRVSTDASRNLTGIVAPALGGREIRLLNVGSNNLVLIHDATSTAANRFLCPGSIDLTLGANSGVILRYDATSSRWRVIFVRPTLVTATTIELGHASDTTVSRVSAGVVAVEGVNLLSTATGAAKYLTINSQTGTTYTLVLTDADGVVVECNNASAITLTIPLNSSVAFPIGTVINLYQLGAGQVTVAITGGGTLRAPSGAKLRVQYSEATLRKRDTDTWVLSGDLTT